MVFLDPKVDIVFKKLFSNQAKTEIVISFLNSILERKDGELITEVLVSDPNNHPDIPDLKSSIVDVRCTDETGKQYIVEMQVIKQKDYAERCQYYAALAVSRQLNKKDKYTKLTPVIFVGITCFKLFESKNYLSHHLLLNSETQEHGLRLLEFHFIELPKFQKTLEQLSDIADKWIYMLKNVDSLEDMPEELSQPQAVEDAMGLLQQASWTTKELNAYDRYLDSMRVLMSTQETAVEDAKLAIARQLLAEMSIEKVAQITGLSERQVRDIKNG
jgi:predicted transposase/invertase (TIGR01784 family)